MFYKFISFNEKLTVLKLARSFPKMMMTLTCNHKIYNRRGAGKDFTIYTITIKYVSILFNKKITLTGLAN